MAETATDPRIITYDDVECAVQMRNLNYRKLTRAKRFISQCPACLADGGDGKLTLAVMVRSGSVLLRCDNDCPPRGIVDALKIDGILTPVTAGDELAGKHGSQVPANSRD